MMSEEDAAIDTLEVSAARIHADEGKVAHFCASEIRREFYRQAEREEDVKDYFDRDPDRPLNANELHMALVSMTLVLVERTKGTGDCSEVDAFYTAEEESTRHGASVSMTRGLSKFRKRKALAHEMAQHLQRARVAPALYGAERVVCNALDGRAIRHNVSTAVEDLVLRRAIKVGKTEEAQGE